MSLKTRRILFILFITAFLIITPLVISYAAGYKFVFGKKAFQKTGMLILDTSPEGARIYLNGELRKNFFKKYFSEKETFATTPTKIKNLLPGEYEIKIEKDGYWPWGKKLEVKPGITAFAEDIYLFKQSLPLLLAGGSAQDVLLSPDKKKLAVIKDKGISIIDLENDNIKKFEISEKNQKLILWSPNSKKILAGTSVFNLENESEKIELNSITEESRWNGNNEITYITDDGKNILNLNLETQINKKLYTGEKIIDFSVKDNNLFTVSQTNNGITLSINEIANLKNIRNIELPAFYNFRFINLEHNLINLYDEKQQILYLINPFSNFPITEIINNIKYTSWVGEKKLLYGNNYEIWTIDFSDNQTKNKTLLTRISSQINKIIWHPSDNYIIYSDNNGLYALELDDREKRNTTKLADLNINFLNLNNDGNITYFYTKIGNQEGVYKLAIQ